MKVKIGAYVLDEIDYTLNASKLINMILLSSEEWIGKRS